MLPRLRAALHRQFEPEAWTRGGLSPANRTIIALILVSVAVTIVQTEPAIGSRAQGALAEVERAIGVVFLTEYLLRLWIAPETPRFSGRFGRLRYAASWPAIVDLLALAPLALGAAGGEAFLLRLMRLLRILRIARLGRFSRSFKRLWRALLSRQFEFAITLAFGGALLLIASTLMYLAEGGAQPDAFGSIPRAMWWSVATLTTVGYGDVTPITPLGRLLAGVTAVIGIGVIAMPAGIVASALGEALAGRRRSGEDG
mgnify:CR=1 FL=1